MPVKCGIGLAAAGRSGCYCTAVQCYSLCCALCLICAERMALGTVSASRAKVHLC